MSPLKWRFPTLIGLVVLLSGIGGWWYYWGSGARNEASLGATPKQVRISNIADNKFNVSWVTTDKSAGLIEWGVLGEKLTHTARDERDSGGMGLYTTHYVTIAGLQPSTQYAFRIMSGERGERRFDNNGSPYTTTTGPVIALTPSSESLYGVVQLATGAGAEGALVYLTLPGSGVASTLVPSSGKYTFTLSTIRSGDGRSYVKYDPTASIVSVSALSDKAESIVNVSLANSAPVPTITLGQNADFLNPEQVPVIAQTEPVGLVSPAPSAEPVATTPSILNVEPLTDPEINQVSTGSVKLLNPKDPGELLSTLRPEFLGSGPPGLTLSIALTGQKSISDTVKIDSQGKWSWTPAIDLKAGKQKISVSYIASNGQDERIDRDFSAEASSSGLDPAFVSTPSASVTASATPTATPTPSPRAAMPATDSGVPVTGVIENTLLTAGAGVVIMVLGAILILF